MGRELADGDAAVRAPAASHRLTGSSRPTSPSPAIDASSVAVIALVTEPISKRASAAQPALRLVTMPAPSTAAADTATALPSNAPSKASTAANAAPDAQVTVRMLRPIRFLAERDPG